MVGRTESVRFRERHEPSGMALLTPFDRANTDLLSEGHPRASRGAAASLSDVFCFDDPHRRAKWNTDARMLSQHARISYTSHLRARCS